MAHQQLWHKPVPVFYTVVKQRILHGPLNRKDEPGRSDEGSGWEVLAVMLGMSYL